MPISPEETKYLKNKNKGGTNNAKGERYEHFFATYQIASYMYQHLTRLKSVYLSAQLENAFVDDLLIEEPNKHRIYCQLKDIKKVMWGNGRLSTLKYDFKRQIDICLENDEDFELKLVYSPFNAKVTVPEEVGSYTSILHFPACSSINQLILIHSPFKDAIRNIAVNPETTDEELAGIASGILGAWLSGEQKNVSLQQISDYVQSMDKGYINMKTYPSVAISNECKVIFERIVNFIFYTRGTMLYWSCGNLSGKLPWTEDLEKRIIDVAPVEKWKLIEILG